MSHGACGYSIGVVCLCLLHKTTALCMCLRGKPCWQLLYFQRGGYVLDAEQGFRTPIASTDLESAQGMKSCVIPAVVHFCGAHVAARLLLQAYGLPAASRTKSIDTPIVLQLSTGWSYATLLRTITQSRFEQVQVPALLVREKHFFARALHYQPRVWVFCCMVTERHLLTMV